MLRSLRLFQNNGSEKERLDKEPVKVSPLPFTFLIQRKKQGSNIYLQHDLDK